VSKICPKCKVERPLKDYYNNLREKGGKYPTCKNCMDKQHYVYAKTKKGKQAIKKARLKKYGISLEKYMDLLYKQKGVCAICKQPETKICRGGTIGSLAVDHDHNTEEIRGLLCNACNRGIGYMRDNPDLLRKAANYLEIEYGQ
jgi:hypothetical protein